MEEVLVHDVIEEILAKLPVKSLLRFKSVSKQWKSTIESRIFQHNHFIHHCQKSKNPNLLSISMHEKFPVPILENVIILESESKPQSSITNNISIPSKFNLFMVCRNNIDGLICLYDDNYSVIIFNPATRWYRTLPPSTYQQRLRLSTGQYSQLGFGKDQISGLYKLVWLYSSPKATICEVFDFNINAWRFLKRSKPSSLHRIHCWYNPVYLNGLLYWLTEEEITSVLSLDLHTETFEIVCKTPLEDTILYNLCDNLCGAAAIGDNVVIWSLNLEEKTWKKMYNVDMVKICPNFKRCCCGVSLVAFVGENKNKLMLFSNCGCVGSRKQRLMIYDHGTTASSSSSSRVLCIRPFINSVCYFQSLISIL